MDYQEKQSSKIVRFFEWLFAIVVVNLLTIALSIFVITLFPAVTAAFATIKGFKEVGTTHILRSYFYNFKKTLERSFLLGIIVIIIIAICAFSMYFYKNHFDVKNPLGQAGFWAMGVVMFLVIILSLHLPLIMVNFGGLSFMDTIRVAFFITFRYILSTLVLLLMLAVSIIGFIAFPIWLLIGVSMPILISVKLTDATYYYLKKIDLEQIMAKAKAIEEGEEDEE